MTLRERLEKLYDGFYARADAIIKKHQPCEVLRRGSMTICADCPHEPYKRVSVFATQPNLLCCGGCEHHDPEKGCQADKPLACKLWLCKTAQRKHPKIAEELFRIHNEAWDVLGELCGRKDRKQTIDHIIKFRTWHPSMRIDN